MHPVTRFTKSGEAYLAYAVLGTGDAHVVLTLAGPTNLEALWDIPELSGMIEQLAEISRVAIFDRRGVGLSDRVSGDVDLATSASDIVAVMEAAGFETAVLIGGFDSGCACLAAAALYPDRVLGVVGNEVAATLVADDDHPYGVRPEMVELLERIAADDGWGQARTLEVIAGGLGHDARVIASWQRYERMAATPATALWNLRAMFRADARPFLADVHVPVLLLHAKDNPFIEIAAVRWLAERLEDARVVEVEGSLLESTLADGPVLAEVEDFLLGTRTGAHARHELAVMLITDLVGSTKIAARLGEDAWRRALEDHRRVVRGALARHGGREVDTTGDGFLATFRLVTQALQCAEDIRDRCLEAGVDVRQGIHAGEVSVLGGDIAGQAVHATARVTALAGAGEILVSDTAAALAAGGKMRLEPAGTHTLRGLPGRWRLHRLVTHP